MESRYVRKTFCLESKSTNSELISTVFCLQKAVKRGEIPYIDPRYSQRSKEEKVLVELIEKCFAYDPDLRPTIFEVVTYLRNAVNKSLRENESRADILKALVSDE